ncbi:precursor to secretory protein [Moniliophthora roreri MCA 2997]|uniref:Precursor to secretory protein n=1 Tax=Moniliophthora roreri (strain MCA 2997) TaxID=1381753 RepID=V2YWR7_MONRO|nr:precursor to secretory protein [Moniliophthora roreri MCA 2997]
MKALNSLSFVSFISVALAHGGHSGPEKGETIQQYARRHMAKEHHIDSFDLRSFFQLHDLNRDGNWDRDEIEAIYGVHHVYSQKKSKDDIEHQQKADKIVNEVLRILDADKNGKVTPEEFEKVGLDGLPNFDHLGAEGHHYDVESEFFLHHEEEFHSTPETQTDESYTHPEDIEHFAQHEAIEMREAEKEAKFQGISVEEVLAQHAEAEAAAAAAAAARPETNQEPMGAEHPHAEQGGADSPPSVPNPRITRVTPPEKQDPAQRFRSAKAEADKKGEWGSGSDGYKRPVKPEDKMRKNLPYKYKFRRSWGDF